MLQVSSTLRHEWYFEDGVPVLGAVSVRRSSEIGSGAFNNAAGFTDFAPLDDEATYTIALTSYLAAGGDGFMMFRGLPATPMGKTQVEITTEYLANTAASPPGLPMPSDGRIVQKPAVMRLNLGILCSAASHEQVAEPPPPLSLGKEDAAGGGGGGAGMLLLRKVKKEPDESKKKKKGGGPKIKF